MRWGLVFWGLLIVVAIGAIVALCLRPTTVIGVSEKSLAYSLRGAADADETGRCQEIESDTRFACTAPIHSTTKASEVKVDVDDFGCWKTLSDGGPSDQLSGCITVTDLIRAGD